MPVGILSRCVIVFDLDGTLVDTAPDLIATLNHVLLLEGLPAVRPERIRARIGEGAKALIAHGARMSGASFSPDKIAALTETFLGYYAAHCLTHSRIFPGVEHALSALRDYGARLAVCTNKHGNLARKILAGLTLADRFSAVVGGDEVPNKKPHGDHFALAVDKAGGTLRHALMVGDSGIDIASARACNAKAVIVDFGYSAIPAHLLGADAVISGFEALPAVTSRLLPHARHG